jgi:hypothetical protein
MMTYWRVDMSSTLKAMDVDYSLAIQRKEPVCNSSLSASLALRTKRKNIKKPKIKMEYLKS